MATQLDTAHILGIGALLDVGGETITIASTNYSAVVGEIEERDELAEGGVRQGLPVGAITSATLWDLVPFENEIVTVKLTGEQLLAAAGNVEARFAGLRAKGEGFVDGQGSAIDPRKVYTLATNDYLYLGGDGFKLNEADKAPTQTRVSIQTALIEWTKGKKSDQKKPLETQLPK
jgi:2',3'-cyclic-nucleotide 2'-phosphodiesterase (5'-nucleotidase family)